MFVILIWLEKLLFFSFYLFHVALNFLDAFFGFFPIEYDLLKTYQFECQKKRITF